MIGDINKEIELVRNEIEALVKKAYCSSCHKTLFFYDGKRIFIKCKHCKTVTQFLLDNDKK
jgi:LSD1 subclass zinc finger protein